MSIQAELHLDGNVYTIKRFSHKIAQNTNNNGFPCSKPKHAGLNISIDAVKDTLFDEWSIAEKMTKQIEIHFIPNIIGQSRTRILKCFDCYLVDFATDYEAYSNELATFNLHITCGGIEPSWSQGVYSENWRKTFPNEVEPTVIEEAAPQITSLEWVNSNTQEQGINSINYNENASLLAIIENPQGNTATITIEKEDGTEFANGETMLSFTETINEDGVIELTPMEIKEQWEGFKTSEIDKLVAKVAHGEVTKNSKPLQIIPDPKVIVDFRPAKNYNGEYGFDYIRDKTKKDSVTYKDILGENHEYDKVKKKWVEKFTKYKTDTKYNTLKDSHYKTTKFPWYKDSKGKEIEYIQSWLTIYPQDSVTLSLQVNTIENANKESFTFEYDKSLFKLSTETLPAQAKGKKRLNDHLQIECLKEFNSDQIIKVMHGKRQLGQLNIYKNAKANRKKAPVVFVSVKTNLKGTGKGKTGTTQNKKGKCEDEMLYMYLKQAYITLENEEIVFDLTELNTKTKKPKYPDFNTDFGLIDTRDPKRSKILNKYHNSKAKESLVKFMESELNKAYPKYANHFKVFFFADRGGRKDKKTGKIKGLGGYAKDFNSQAVIVFNGRGEATVTHELLHAIGLHHSFEYKKDFSYKKGETTNIMDYSHLRKYGSKNRNQIWLWQMKKLWTNKNLKPE